MRIVISSGHGLYVRGASGYIDEVDEARKVVDRVAEILNSAGIITTVFHDNTSHSQSENLSTIVDFHNRQERDLDVSVHFNCYETTNDPRGVEVLWTSTSGKPIAVDTSDAISIAGHFINRGAKERNDLAFLNNTEETAILIETCFVDSKADVNNYYLHFESICSAIAEAISGETIPGQPPSPPEEPSWRPPETVPVENRPTLSEGDEGQDVIDLQMMLPRFGVSNVDGDFGSYTDSEVRDYQ